MPAFMWTGISATSMQGFTMAIARAMFQAQLLPVFTFTTGPYMVAPAFCTTFSCSSGHMPASRLPSYSSWPCMPRTNSPAMPSCTPIVGYFLRMISVARSVAQNSGSPEAPVVSKSMASAPASYITSAMRTASWTAISAASSAAARASAILPSGSSVDQLSQGPSSFAYRPRFGMMPYCIGAIVQSRASCRRCAS